MISVVLALTEALSSAGVKTLLAGKASAPSNITDAATGLASEVIPNLLSAHTADGPTLTALEAKLDRIAAQRFNAEMETGRRYLSDAMAYYRSNPDRLQMLETARHAFTNAAGSAVTTEGAVNAEFFVAGCWLATGSIKDVYSSFKVAHDRCLSGVLDACKNYRTTPGLLDYWKSRSLLSQTIDPVDSILAQGRRKIREPSTRKLRDLGILFNDVQGLRREYGMRQGCSLLQGYSIGSPIYIPPPQMRAYGDPLTVCQPVIADDGGLAQVGPILLMEAEKSLSIVNTRNPFYMLEGHFTFLGLDGYRPLIMAMDPDFDWKQKATNGPALVAPEPVKEVTDAQLNEGRSSVDKRYEAYVKSEGITFTGDTIEISDVTTVRMMTLHANRPTSMSFQIALPGWRGKHDNSSVIMLVYDLEPLWSDSQMA